MWRKTFLLQERVGRLAPPLLPHFFSTALKVASNKCSLKKVFLAVDRAVKMTCFYIDHHLLYKKV